MDVVVVAVLVAVALVLVLVHVVVVVLVVVVVFVVVLVYANVFDHSSSLLRLGTVTCCRRLDLGGNRFVGSLPEFLISLTALRCDLQQSRVQVHCCLC